MRISEALVNLKSCFEFEKSLLTSKYEYLLRHRLDHPEAYEKKDQEDKIDLEKDWRKYCCQDGVWSKWLVERLTQEQLEIYEKFKSM